MNAHATPNNTKTNIDDQHQSHNQLLVDFPARSRHRCQELKQVRFASHITVQPITSVLAVCSKEELWYSTSTSDVTVMRRMMKRDAAALAQTLLSPSAKDLEEGIDMSQAVGLDKNVNPFEIRRVQKTMTLQKQAVVMLQDEVQDEHELHRISERFSRTSSERAHTLAVHWVGGHIGRERIRCGNESISARRLADPEQQSKSNSMYSYAMIRHTNSN